MTTTPVRPWRRLERASTLDLVDARLQLHHAAQIPGSIGGSLLDPEPEWAHLSLDWIETAGALASHPVPGPSPVRIGLSVEEVALVQLEREDEVLERFPLTGRTFAEGLAGAATGASLTPPDHELPYHAVREGAPWTLEAGRASSPNAGALARTTR